jgi:hypothetical protein
VEVIYLVEIVIRKWDLIDILLRWVAIDIHKWDLIDIHNQVLIDILRQEALIDTLWDQTDILRKQELIDTQ